MHDSPTAWGMEIECQARAFDRRQCMPAEPSSRCYEIALERALAGHSGEGLHTVIVADSAAATALRKLSQQYGLVVRVISVQAIAGYGGAESEIFGTDAEDYRSAFDFDLLWPRATEQPIVRGYLSVLQLLSVSSCPPEGVLVVSDAICPGEGTRAVQLDTTMVRQYVDGYGPWLTRALETISAIELDASPTRDEALEWLTARAERLAEAGAMLHALQLLITLHALRPSSEGALKIAIAWRALECPKQALAWLARTPPAGDIHAQLEGELAYVLGLQEEAARQCLEDNLAHLQRSYPDVARSLESQANACEHLDVVWLTRHHWLLAIEGDTQTLEAAEYPLLVDTSGGLPRIVNAPADPRTVADGVRSVVRAVYGHVCVGALNSHATLVNVLRNRISSETPNWSQTVLIVETHAEYLLRLAQVVDYRSLLVPERVACFVGSDAEAQLVAYLRARPARPLPGLRFALSPDLAAGLRALERERIDQTEQLRSAVAEGYDPARPTLVLEALRQRRPLKIWSWNSIHTTVLQYVARDLLAAFAGLGHDTHHLIESHPGEQLDFACVGRSMIEYAPDLIVLLDHTRADCGGMIPASTPVICWALDELPNLKNPERIAQLGALDITMAWSPALCDTYSELGHPAVEQLTFAANLELYDRPAECEPRDEVAYATHLTFPSDPACNPGFCQWLLEEFSWVPEIPSGQPEAREFLHARERQLPALPTTDDDWNLLLHKVNLVSRYFDRVSIADALLAEGLPLALYGRGWSDIPRFRKYARGLVQPGEALRRIYQSHKVVLHINIGCNLHMRVFEAAAAGAFVLARADPFRDREPGWVDDHLKIGRELCIFADRRELTQMVRRAFSDEKWRRSFADAARERVRADHSYASRATTMLDVLRSRLELKRSRDAG